MKIVYIPYGTPIGELSFPFATYDGFPSSLHDFVHDPDHIVAERALALIDTAGQDLAADHDRQLEEATT